MRCEILTIGTELLLGFTVDTNAGVMGTLLAAAGVTVTRRATVGDSPAEVRAAIREAVERTGAVICSGGLGPTRDDLTKAALAEAFGRTLVRDAGWMQVLEQRYRARGIPMPASNAVQADLPEGAVLLHNPLGSAPGVWFEDGAALVVLLPGVPKELHGLMEGEVVPRLLARAAGAEAGAVIRSRTLRTTGISEAALADALGRYENLLGTSVTLAFIPSHAGTDLRLTAWSLPEADATAALARGVDALRPRIAPHIYAEGDDDLAGVVLGLLQERGAKLAVAESCTGGLIGARLTAVPGSSRAFTGGVVAYANDVKLDFLGVSADTLAGHGAVSEAVAREMADGAARVFGVEAAIAVTGIAGPDGGTSEKPVGTTWIAIRWRESVRAWTFVFPGDRDDVRQRAAQWALDRLRRLMLGGG